MSVVQTTTSPSSERQPSEDGFISELHGVRGVALALVVLFHVFGQGRVSGGVDVFLFVSGFLLTISMYRRSVARSPGRLKRHYARTLLRLLPAAAVVLIATTAAVFWLRPLSVRVQDLAEIRASALYYENFELIASQLSYGAAGPETSPMQHFWSLAVQGQFFLLWPLVMLAVVALGLRVNRPWLVTTLSVALVTVAGFVAAQVMVVADQPVAYFHTLSRWWELSAGGLTGLLLMRWRPSGVAAAVLGWLGFTAIVVCGFLVDGATAFPGPWVLLPLAGAAAVLAGSGAPEGPNLILSARPLVWIADSAYELYLWHWPILVFTLVYLDANNASFAVGSGVVVASVVAAWLTHRFVSKPVLALRRVDPAQIIALAATVMVFSGFVLSAQSNKAEAEIEASLKVSSGPANNYPGAEAVLDPSLARSSYPVPARPPVETAGIDKEAAVFDKCWQNNRKPASPIKWCNSPQRTAKSGALGPTVALIGSSRAIMWLPAIEQVRQNWVIKSTARGSCPVQLNAESEQCREWNRLLLIELEKNPPDAIFVEGTEVSRPRTQAEQLAPNRVAAWRQIANLGVKVLAIRAAPRYSEDPPVCLARVGLDSLNCDVPAADLYAKQSPMQSAGVVTDSIREIDLTGTYCPNGRCSAVIGNVVAARDSRHFTATFAQTLGRAVEVATRKTVPGLFNAKLVLADPRPTSPPRVVGPQP